MVLGLSILTLIAGFVTMHSLGLGHDPTAMTGAASSASAGHVTLHAVDSAPHAEAALGSCPTCATVLAGAARTVHQMGSMCLGVLPMLLLLLLRPLRRRAAATATATLALGRSAFALTARGPPGGHLRPSLSKLCVLRT